MSHFNANAIDDLLNNISQSTQNIQKQLQEDDEEDLIPASQVSPQIEKMINQKNGLSVDYSRVYAQLEKLIENGNVALQVVNAIDPDVTGTDIASSTASLLNAIKNCVAQFTKIHLQHIKFQQVIQLQQLKHKHKMEELQARKQIYQAKNNNIIDIKSTELKTDKDNNTLIPWQTQGINSYLNYLKKEKESNK